MKKNLCYLLIVGSVVILSSCKSTESAYKQAYEKAVQQDVVQTETTPVVAPAATPQTSSEDAANVPVREEKVTVVSGDANLKAYSIVCGSFSLKTNADALRQRLINDGYPAVVVVNEAGDRKSVV